MTPNPLDALADTQTEFGSSRTYELQRCAVAFDLKYRQGITPRKRATYFDVGSYVHAGLRWVNEGVIAGESEPRDWGAVLQAAADQRTAEFAWDETDPLIEAERLLGAYYGFHGIANGGWPEAAKLIAAELLLESPTATARADLVISLGGEIIVCDTKTRKAKIPDDREAYARGLRAKEQFLRLSWLAQQHFHTPEPPPVWQDAIIKTKIPKVDRLLVRFTQAEVDAWAWNDLRLQQHAATLPIVRNYNACAPEIGSRCSFFEWCHGAAENRSVYYQGPGLEDNPAAKGQDEW